MSAERGVPNEVDLEAGGHVKGLATAIVRQNKDDSGHVSVRVSYPWHSEPRQSYPARVAMPMAGKDRGMYFVPEVNDEVVVGFIKGSLERPLVIGSVWNGVDTSREKNSDGKNDKRLIRSRKGHQLLFDDGSKGVVQVELNDGKKLRIDDDGITLEDDKGNRLVLKSANGDVTLEAKGRLTLKGSSVSIEATSSLDLDSKGTAMLKGTTVHIN
jgi:uncharacterized protein involved in type VI secretion and phage assembly